MTIEDEIKKLEELLQSLKKSLQFAIDTRNKQRESTYRNRIRDTENRLKELGKRLPLESNKYLREEISKLNDKITQLQETNKKEREERVKYIIEEERVHIKRMEQIADMINDAIKEFEEIIGKPIVEAVKTKVNDLLNIPKKDEPEDNDLTKCPACGRSFKGAKGVAAHQRSGACKAAK